ncbi:MAG: PqqD family protein [Lachnospiraceae bacterium]|nr:PqqD family protein [Lachnospiraceae bacterium]MBP5733834.1 PqqD family protein [Lachnospiraceae bacterium]
MKLKEGVIVNEIDGQTIAVDAGSGRERFNGLIRLNKTGGFVIGLLQNDTDMDSIVRALTEKYDVTAEVARVNAAKVIDALAGAGLLD